LATAWGHGHLVTLYNFSLIYFGICTIWLVRVIPNGRDVGSQKLLERWPVNSEVCMADLLETRPSTQVWPCRIWSF